MVSSSRAMSVTKGGDGMEGKINRRRKVEKMVKQNKNREPEKEERRLGNS